MFEKIVSIKSLGKKKVYDLTIDSKFHNFYANDIVVHNSAHSTCYAYIAFQTLFLKCYYPAYFFAAMINMENDIDKINEIIIDAKECDIDILPHSITKSKYQTSVQDDKTVRLGYGMIKGMGNSAKEAFETLELNNCVSLNEILEKDFGKINGTQFQNLIDLGAFDDFNIDREKIIFLRALYSDEKIESWFTRKKQTLRLEVIPKILKENFDEMECLKLALKLKSEAEPWKLLISELIKKVSLEPLNKKKYSQVTIKKQTELLGFTLYGNEELKDLSSSLKAKGFLPLSDFEDESKEYYFTVEKKSVALTKTNKRYLQLTLSDGKKTIKAKCWRELDLEDNKLYYGKFKKDTYGFTLDANNVYKV